MLENEVVKSVPKEAWSQLAKTACDTFEKIILPLTMTTEGISKLIQTKFNKLNVEQQIIAAKCIQETEEKVKKCSQSKNVVIKPLVVYEALDNTEQQTDETMRGLWANLLAKEITEGSVHPEIAKLLGKITSHDALLLLKIAESDSTPIPIVTLKALGAKVTLGLLNEKKTFNHVHLEKIGLIHEVETIWRLTTAGREFMSCVGDPQ